MEYSLLFRLKKKKKGNNDYFSFLHRFCDVRVRGAWRSANDWRRGAVAVVAGVVVAGGGGGGATFQPLCIPGGWVVPRTTTENRTKGCVWVSWYGTYVRNVEKLKSTVYISNEK